VYAFVDVTVVPMDWERTMTGMTVVVRDGCIVAIGSAASMTVPAGAARIDASGKYLMPGLAEMHAHIPQPDSAGSMVFAEEVLFLYVANGITTIRGMLGHPSHLALRGRVAGGALLGPRIWTSGPSVNGTSVTTVDAARRAALEQHAAGYDFIKIHPGVLRDVFDTLDATADRVGMAFAGHVPDAVGVWRALEAGYATIDHLDGYMTALLADGAPVDRSAGGFFGAAFAPHVDDAKLAPIAQATRDRGVWNVPTQTLMASFASDEPAETRARRPEIRYIPAQMRQSWINATNRWLQDAPPAPVRSRFLEVRRALIKALHDAGAGLLLGSDAPQVWNVPGFSIARELEEIVSAGLTPYQALRTGTRNVAAFFGVEDEAGTVTVGKRADLLLLDANPLTSASNVAAPAGVMVYGRWLPRNEIDARLEEIAAAHQAGR
jgi:imidazolonepropionase-like amidohydrolase